MPSGGNGSIAHFAGALFKMGNKVEGVHVPYRGAPDIFTSLLPQQAHCAFAVLVSAVPLEVAKYSEVVRVSGARVD